jgi:multidrug efflux pump subunit AcrB
VNLPKFAVNRKSLVLAAATLALFWSLAAALTMQRREDPGTEQRQTEIVTLFPGATTENVEQLITKKIADEVRGVAHVEHVNGVSRPGISDIEVDFDDALQHAEGPLKDVRNKLDDLKGQLPAGIAGPTIVDDVWQTYPMLVGITADGLTQRQLRDVAKTLEDRLASLPDVGLVRMVGEQEQQVDVALDTRALSTYGLAPSDVVTALAGKNALAPNGSLAVGGRLAQVDPSDGLKTPSDVASAPVATPNGRVVRVADVARVRTGYPDPPTEVVHVYLAGERRSPGVGGRPAVVLAVQVKETSSVTELGPEVEGALAQARANWPAGIDAALLADQPRTVDERVADFAVNLILGVVLVTVLVALLMGLRNGLLVGLTVVLSIVLTFGAMPLVHVDINQISLLALIIALGVIVDAGIVSIDNIERHLCAGTPRREAAWRGVQELWVPLLTSTLVAMSSFLPFRLMGGAIGDFVRDLAVVTSLALAMSLLVAYFLTPIVAERFAAAANGATARGPAARLRTLFDRLLGTLQRGYVPLASAAMRAPLVTVAIAALLLAAAALGIPRLGVQFFPSADRNQFFVDVTAPDGTDIRATEAIVRRVGALVAEQHDVTTYGAFIGRGAPRFYYNVISEQPRPNYAQLIVDTTDVAAAKRLVPLLRDELARRVAGARIEVKPLEQGPPVGAPIQVRIAAEDAALLPPLAARLGETLHAIPGTVAVRDSLGQPTTKFDVTLDPQRAAETGVSDAAVQQLLALAYGGSVATEIRERDRQTPVVVRLPQSLRSDVSALTATSVRGAGGANIPLGEIASIALGTQTSTTTIRDGLPTVTIAADVVGRLPSEVLADLRSALARQALPSDVRLTYAGEDEQTTKSFRNLALAAIVGLLVNQTILLWEFRALHLSLVILAAVPLGLIGAVTGLAVTGNHFGFVASLGLASLGGVVTNHTIVLFEYALREREHDPSIAMEQALIVAGTKRLRPILLTVVTSIAGLLPLAFSSQTLWRPFCWAVIFGLGASMLMTLVAIPALYRLTSREPSAERAQPRPAGGVGGPSEAAA